MEDNNPRKIRILGDYSIPGTSTLYVQDNSPSGFLVDECEGNPPEAISPTIYTRNSFNETIETAMAFYNDKMREYAEDLYFQAKIILSKPIILSVCGDAFDNFLKLREEFEHK